MVSEGLRRLNFSDRARYVLAKDTYCASKKACMREAFCAFVPETGR